MLKKNNVIHGSGTYFKFFRSKYAEKVDSIIEQGNYNAFLSKGGWYDDKILAFEKPELPESLKSKYYGMDDIAVYEIVADRMGCEVKYGGNEDFVLIDPSSIKSMRRVYPQKVNPIK